jgi:hypothetical protein
MAATRAVDVRVLVFGGVIVVGVPMAVGFHYRSLSQGVGSDPDSTVVEYGIPGTEYRAGSCIRWVRRVECIHGCTRSLR